MALSLRLKDVRQVLDLPLAEAATRLGVSESSLKNYKKRTMRIQRWPYRKIRALRKAIAGLRKRERSAKKPCDRYLLRWRIKKLEVQLAKQYSCGPRAEQRGDDGYLGRLRLRVMEILELKECRMDLVKYPPGMSIPARNPVCGNPYPLTGDPRAGEAASIGTLSQWIADDIYENASLFRTDPSIYRIEMCYIDDQELGNGVFVQCTFKL